MGYKLLGMAVWKGARWWVRRRYGDRPRQIALGLLVLGVVGALAAGARRASG